MRSLSFAVMFTSGVVALAPLFQRLLIVTADQHRLLFITGLALTLIVLFLATTMIAVLVERHVADPLHALRLDVRRSLVAEEHGRRGGSYLTNDPAEPLEIAQLREQVRALHEVMQGRLDGEQRWVASAVHDVKAGLVGVAYLLDAEHDDGAAARLAVARDEAKRLVEVLSRLTDLVRFSSLEAIEQREVDLSALVAKVVAKRHDMHLVAPHVRLEADAGGGGREVRVRGDAGLLERAFVNLIENAVRVARSSVRVSVYPGLVRIEDDGPDLKQDLATLTQPFRSETLTISGVPVPGGTLGLGLFIARRVLEAHGGRLAVERTSSDGTVILAYLGGAR